MPKELRRAPDSLSVWESNMKELERRQPNLAVLLKKYVADHGHDFPHYETQTPAGRWIDGLSGEPFFEREGEPKFNWSRASREDKNKPVFFLYGAGMPPYLFKAIKALPEAALSLIVVEPHISLVAYALHLTHVYPALPGNCLITFLTEPEARDETVSRILTEECLATALRPVGIFSAALAELSFHEGEADAWGGAFRRMGGVIKEWVTVTLMYLGNSAEDTLLGFRQIALMSPMIAFGKPLELIKEKFPGRPAILVAAGPSLDKNFMQLKEIQDKCLIIATDAVLSKLLSNGIKPHIVTSLERVLVTYDVFFAAVVEQFPEECADILLVVQSLCVPWTSGRWPGPVCFVHKEEVVVDTWFAGGVLGGSTLISGISVAHMNYSLGYYMGSPYLAIIGQDLAYSEDGLSHAGNIAGGKKADLAGLQEIPGALGGMVKTNNLWLSMLRGLEGIISVYPRPTWDCTEGGAMITGTRVAPLNGFIGKFVEPLDPMSFTPSSCFRENYNDVDVREVGERVLANIARQYEQFDKIDSDLNEVERLMDATAAAGLSPRRRIEFASGAGEALDRIHNRSAVFDFIGQSYTRLATIELALTRNLEDVETVRRWYAMHKEILDSHRDIMKFMREWTSYAERAVAYWKEKGAIEWGPIDPAVAWERALELLGRFESAEGEEMADIRLELNNVMMRCDPVRLGWPGRVLWSYAMLLMTEGRAAFATRFMDTAAADFDGKEMPVAEMGAFFKDYARVLMGRDLVHNPSHLKAETMLANAVGLIGTDDEIKSLLDEVLDMEIVHSAIMDEYKGFEKTSGGRSNWFADRAEAQKQLYDGNVKGALVSVWNAIKKHWRAVPEWAASHIAWLASTLEKCVGVDDPLLAETIDMILTDMVGNAEILYNLSNNFTVPFVQLLESRGLKVEWKKPDEEESETAEETAQLPEVERVGTE